VNAELQPFLFYFVACDQKKLPICCKGNHILVDRHYECLGSAIGQLLPLAYI
jgi:hypothetical protein